MNIMTETNISETPCWGKVCSLSDLIVESGVCALVKGHQIALFYLPKENPTVYAVGNWDPIGKANVLSRGIVGDVKGQLVVASPLYKQHFDLISGVCIEDDAISIPVYPVAIEDNQILIQV